MLRAFWLRVKWRHEGSGLGAACLVVAMRRESQTPDFHPQNWRHPNLAALLAGRVSKDLAWSGARVSSSKQGAVMWNVLGHFLAVLWTPDSLVPRWSLVRKLLCCRAGCVTQEKPGVMDEQWEEMWRGRKKPGLDVKVGSCLGWGSFYSAPHAGWSLLQRPPASSGVWAAGQLQEGKGLALLCEIKGKKTNYKSNWKLQWVRRWFVSHCVLCSSRSCSAAFQKRGRVHASKEDEHENEADSFISQTVLYFWMLTGFNVNYCHPSSLLGWIVLPAPNVPQMYLFHKACHLSTTAITEISCHILFVHSQDLALLLLINLVTSEQLLSTLRKDFSQGAPEPRNITMRKVVTSISVTHL